MSYTWQITDDVLLHQIKNAKPKVVFHSPVFKRNNLRWFLSIFPNGRKDKHKGYVSYYLRLVTVPSTIKSVTFRRTLSNVESNQVTECHTTLSKGDTSSGWPTRTLKTDEIQKYNKLTFTVNITLLCVLDQDDNDITDLYLTEDDGIETQSVVSSFDQQLNTAKLDSMLIQMNAMNAEIKKMKKEINDIKLRMNEEQKNDNDDTIDKLMKKMEIIEQNMNKLSSNDHLNAEQQKFKLWLQNDVKLPQYYDVFVNNGIDELSVVAEIDKDTLKDIGIDIIGHQIKILSKVKQLNKHNKSKNEGRTEYI